MKLKRILSGLLAAGIIASGVLAPEASPFTGALVIEAQAASAPSTPKSFKAESSSVGTVKLSWSKVSGADGIAIYRATKKDGNYKELMTVKGSKTSVKLTDLTEDKTYYFKLRAYKTSNGKNVYSDYTSAKKVTVLSEQSKNLAVMKKKAPLFAEYCEWISGGFPITYDIEIDVTGNFPNAPNLNFSNYGKYYRVRAALESEDKFAVKIYLESGDFISVYVKKNTVYEIHSKDKAAVKSKYSAEDRRKILKSFEELKDLEIPDISHEGIKVNTSKSKYKDKKYLCEKITFEGLKDHEICTYADTKTKEVKYISAKTDTGSMTYRFRAMESGLDESMFSVPAGYKIYEA